MNTLRQVTFSGLGVFAGIAYEPKGTRKWSSEYYSLDNGKYTLIDHTKISIIDYTGAYYRKLVRRINCTADDLYKHAMDFSNIIK